MIEHFRNPPIIKVLSEEDLQYYTRKVDATSLAFAERASAHYTAYLLYAKLERNNTLKGSLYTLCIYDALIALGVQASRITFGARARPERHDDIDMLIEPISPAGEKTCLYLKTSFRERYKQVDRDAYFAKDKWGSYTRTICLIYAENGAEGFFKDLKEPDRVEKKFRQMEKWSMCVDSYAALSQTAKVNALMAALV